MTGLSCASAKRCVAVDSAGHALTFNGKSWSPQRSDRLGKGSASVSCPTTTYCVAVSAARARVSTWNGSTWSRATAVNQTESVAPLEPGLLGISCASARSCSAYDDLGAVHVFDGTGWSASDQVTSGSRSSLDARLTGLSCAADGWCWAVTPQLAYVRGR